MTQEPSDILVELIQRVGILETTMRRVRQAVEENDTSISGALSEMKTLEARITGTQEAAEGMCGILDRLIKKLAEMTGPKGEFGKEVADIMNKDMEEQYRKQFAKLFDVVVELNVGDSVICDLCGKDWTGVETSGGFMFSGKAICPDCCPKIESEALTNDESHLIESRCPPNMAHDDWIRDMIRPALEKGIDLRTIADWKTEEGDKNG